jgi:hypothetical protein
LHAFIVQEWGQHPHGLSDVFISSTQGKEYAMKRDGKREA